MAPMSIAERPERGRGARPGIRVVTLSDVALQNHFGALGKDCGLILS